jgi:hypothetical protein
MNWMEHLVFGIETTVLLGLVVWIYRWFKNIGIMAKFVVHMHDNELPHIHSTLAAICHSVGIEYEPPSEKIPMNGVGD